MSGSLSAFRDAVFDLHGCDSRWVGSFPVTVINDSETAWDGRVQAFDLIGHSEASRAYFWEEPPEEAGGRPQIFAVLEAGGVKHAVDAVRASIAQRKREKEPGAGLEGNYEAMSPTGPLMEDPGDNLIAEPGAAPSPSYEDKIRVQAREAIQSGKLPNRHPDQTWGGPGRGACCTVCGAPTRLDEVELELDFARAGDGPGPVRHTVHPRCFAALEHELQTLAGGEGLSTT
jgi:hypothetical protein